jgi:alkanesulfonate monooxygenase
VGGRRTGAWRGADLIEAYHEVGIEEFVLSGYPHLEEAYWFGEGVLPELARRGLWEHPANGSRSVGVHNDIRSAAS